MTCAPDGCGCGHEHDHQHCGPGDANQQASGHSTGCCGGPAVANDTGNPKVAEKA